MRMRRAITPKRFTTISAVNHQISFQSRHSFAHSLLQVIFAVRNDGVALLKYPAILGVTSSDNNTNLKAVPSSIVVSLITSEKQAAKKRLCVVHFLNNHHITIFTKSRKHRRANTLKSSRQKEYKQKIS